MANGQFLGLNKAGIKPITTAINNYVKKIKNVDFNVTAAQIKVFARGSKSEKAIDSMIDQADKVVENFLKTKIDPFSKRINNLAKQYSSNDSSLSTTMGTNAKNKLKS